MNFGPFSGMVSSSSGTITFGPNENWTRPQSFEEAMSEEDRNYLREMNISIEESDGN
jgi:hypothetical protein